MNLHLQLAAEFFQLRLRLSVEVGMHVATNVHLWTGVMDGTNAEQVERLAVHEAVEDWRIGQDRSLLNRKDWFLSSSWPQIAMTVSKSWFRSTDTVHVKALEIGSFEGLSASCMLDHWPGCELTCVDTFEGGFEHVRANYPMESAKELFMYNVLSVRASRGVRAIQGRSDDVLPKLITAGEVDSFDFVFVDGSHLAADVLSDLVNSFKLIKRGGLIACDDFLWRSSKEDKDFECPEIAIRSFLNCYKPRVRVRSVSKVCVIFEKL